MSTQTASNTMLSTPVSFTAGAIAEINRLMAEPDFDQQQRLKVGVKGGGCSGMTYILGFELPKADDALFTFEGVPCCIETAHQIYLYGMQIDWQGGLNSRGFTFNNPNASSTCGCGTSFAV
ncbi:MAG: iron-sulfur cluster assembly accessory protein [Chitinophagia bacterium]|jgi:iron-sulfur cluster assembly protein